MVKRAKQGTQRGHSIAMKKAAMETVQSFVDSADTRENYT